jgi:hypothetical protein
MATIVAKTFHAGGLHRSVPETYISKSVVVVLKTHLAKLILPFGSYSSQTVLIIENNQLNPLLALWLKLLWKHFWVMFGHLWYNAADKQEEELGDLIACIAAPAKEAGHMDKLHIHANNPEAVFDRLWRFSKTPLIKKEKVEDMLSMREDMHGESLLDLLDAKFSIRLAIGKSLQFAVSVCQPVCTRFY